MAIAPPEDTLGVVLRPFTVAEQAALDQQVDVVHPPEPDPLVQELAIELENAVRDRDELAEFIRNTQSDLTATVEAKAQLEAQLDAMESAVQELLARITELEKPPAAPVDYVFLDEHSEPESVPEPEVQIIAPEETVTIAVSETAPKFKATAAPQPETAPRSKGIAPPPEPETVPEPVSEPESVPEPAKAEEYITDPIVKILNRKPNAGFGTEFPDNPVRGDMFLRTDFRPTRLFKWNDTKWIEVNKATTDAYSYNDAYIQFLADKLFSGEYQLDDLTEVEQQQVQTLIGGTRG
jgi:hypothetical protein